MTDLVATRRSLHAVAELLLAGPQHAVHGTIRQAVCPGGFAAVRAPYTSVVGTELRIGDRAVDLPGRTIAEVGEAASVVPRTLAGVYEDGCGLDETHLLQVDPSAATEIHAAFARGDAALADFSPTADRVLWPEHFDLGITLDEVNYGVSPGDDFLPEPYAYVGPWHRDGLVGDFWNAPFGAARPLREIPDLAGFYAEGAARSGGGA